MLCFVQFCVDDLCFVLSFACLLCVSSFTAKLLGWESK
jgi:hypothetical protein